MPESRDVTGDDVAERERDHWDHHVDPLERCVEAFKAGPDPNTRAMLDAVRPGPGVRILDFACGAGVTTAWLAQAGAEVVGVDLSPVSIRRATELFETLGIASDLRVVDFGAAPHRAGEQFDAMVGRFALHHLDLRMYAPLLRSSLRRGGAAAFLETMATNPVLRFARKYVVGRAGVARIGTADEHPLTRRDLRLLERVFGAVAIDVPSLVMFRLIDRHITAGKRPGVTRTINSLDRFIGGLPGTNSLSYEQVVVCRTT